MCAIQSEFIVVNGQTTTSARWPKLQLFVSYFSWCCMPKIIKIGKCFTKLFKK